MVRPFHFSVWGRAVMRWKGVWFVLLGNCLAALSTAWAQTPPPLLAPRLAVPSVAASPLAYVPPGAEVLQRVRLPGSPSQPEPQADVWLLRQGERLAMLVGARTAHGQFEAWEWATFMNCQQCRDDPTSSWTVRLSTRGAVLTVHGETVSVSDLTSHEASWRLRGLPPADARHPGFELIGQDVRTEARAQGTGSRESHNLITGAYERVEGSVDKEGRFRPQHTTRRQDEAGPKPLASQLPPAF